MGGGGGCGILGLHRNVRLPPEIDFQCETKLLSFSSPVFELYSSRPVSLPSILAASTPATSLVTLLYIISTEYEVRGL